MATFDIFIKGIKPECLDESEQIKHQVSEAFHISLADVDELFALPNGACIRRNASEHEAIEYHATLSDLGLVCYYSPVKQLNLQLEPIEETTPAVLVTCPHCEHEMEVKDIAPQVCLQCGIDIARFLEQKHKQETQQTEQFASQKTQETKEQTTFESKKESSQKTEVKSKTTLKMTLLTVGTGLVVAIVMGNYFVTPSNNPPPATMRIEEPPALAPTEIPQSVASSTVQLPEIEPVSQQPTELSRSSGLLANVENDATWDKFLAQNSKTFLERNQPEKSLKLNHFIVEHSTYINAMGELFRFAEKNKQPQLIDSYLASLETRLASLPIDLQAIYFAQAGGYLALENNTNRLLLKAENLLTSLKTPEQQLRVVLKLAVVYSKLGNTITANDYFHRIDELLVPIADLNLQAELRATVAVAYYEINNSAMAMQWLDSTKPSLLQLKSETIRTLAISYAQCNQWQSVLTLLADVKENYDAWLYQAIRVSLQSGFVINALELHKSLHAPIYQALADILIADYSPSTANELLASAEQITNTLPTFEKALTLSQLIDYHGRMQNKTKVKTLVATNKDLLMSLPASTEKDELLNAITLHYAHGLQAEQGSFLLTSIQSSPLKTRLNVELNHLADVNVFFK